MKRLQSLFGGILCLLFVASAHAGSPNSVQHRPISDFVDAQGTYCTDDGAGGCLLYVPPVANFYGWYDPKTNVGLSMDYAGLADKKLRELTGNSRSFGTVTEGTVTERPMADGRALVHVTLRTKNALTFAVNFVNYDYATDPLAFGVRLTDVLGGQTPALGESQFSIQFINSAMGAPLPDLFAVSYEDTISSSFRGTATWTAPDGQKYRVEVIQVGGGTNTAHTKDGYPAEKITIQPVGN